MITIPPTRIGGICAIIPTPRFYGADPTRSLRDVPLILVRANNYGKMEPVVANLYNEFEYIRLWWPNQDYFGLTWERVVEALRNPQMRVVLNNLAKPGLPALRAGHRARFQPEKLVAGGPDAPVCPQRCRGEPVELRGSSFYGSPAAGSLRRQGAQYGSRADLWQPGCRTWAVPATAWMWKSPWMAACISPIRITTASSI